MYIADKDEIKVLLYNVEHPLAYCVLVAMHHNSEATSLEFKNPTNMFLILIWKKRSSALMSSWKHERGYCTGNLSLCVFVLEGEMAWGGMKIQYIFLTAW